MRPFYFLTFLVLTCAFSFSSCKTNNGSWTENELSIIEQDSAIVRVLQITNPEDSLVLRRQSTDIPTELVGEEQWNKLAAHMFATVQDEANPGVGIAAPQIGISRRIVAVQRFDKEGEPFEIYPNIRIVNFNGEKQPGPEGCLSVPDRRGEVLRYRNIDITYTSLKTLADTTETIQGFTAVIFQHECDHLDGVIYTDKI